MGTRYILTYKCVCGHGGTEEDVYYAPTCGITNWTCPKCGHCVDLEAYTGITYKMASNRQEIVDAINAKT